MGEIAEMMMDGTLCEGCGVFLNDDVPGYPCRCGDCAREARADRKAANIAAHNERQVAQKKTPCPTCGRRVKAVGLANHIKDAHPALTAAGAA